MDPATHAELTSHKTMHIHGSMRTSGFGSPHLAMLRRPLGQCHQPGRREDSTAAAPFRSARSPCVSTGLYPRKGVMSAGLYPRKGVMWHLGDVVWTSSTALPPLLSFLCTAAQAAHLQTAITLADFFVNAVTTRFKDNVPDFDLTCARLPSCRDPSKSSTKEMMQACLVYLQCHVISLVALLGATEIHAPPGSHAPSSASALIAAHWSFKPAPGVWRSHLWPAGRLRRTSLCRDETETEISAATIGV